MEKKPVVLASNRGRHSPNQIKLVEWCLSMMPLEPFFKDKPPLEVPGIELFRGSPHPSPHGEGW